MKTYLILALILGLSVWKTFKNKTDDAAISGDTDTTQRDVELIKTDYDRWLTAETNEVYNPNPPPFGTPEYTNWYYNNPAGPGYTGG
jgi:hypothetical protein